jgi:hypothetical protein
MEIARASSNARHVGILRLSDLTEHVVACLLAAAAELGADAAMFVVGGVPRALFGTAAAGDGAGLDRGAKEGEIRRGLAGQDAACRLTDIGAIEIETDAADQLRQVCLAETGVSAAGAGGRTVEALLDTAKEDATIEAGRPRMRSEDLSKSHVLSFRLMHRPMVRAPTLSVRSADAAG